MASNSREITLDDVVVNGIVRVRNRNKNKVWTGTMTELRSNLVKVLNKKQSAMLPGSPGALRVVVNRVINRLRSRAVSVKFARTPDHDRTRYVVFA